MAFQVRIPSLGESVTEGTIVRWAKQDGEAIKTDEVLLELETDKASMEIPAEQAGVVKILKPAGTTVQVGEVVCEIDASATPSPSPAAKTAPTPAPAAAAAPPAPAAKPVMAPPPPAARPVTSAATPGPAARHLLAEHGMAPDQIAGTGKGGRITKGDVLAHVEKASASAPPGDAATPRGGRAERPVALSRIRKRIAERLVDAQRTAAILTTFNEIDMGAVLDLRARYKEAFQKKHGIGLGFMSLFGAACVAALREVPAVNAEIRGDEVVYKDFVHLGIAVGTERGLVVPVVRDADLLDLAGLEREIARLAGLARDGKLVPDDLMGGTFTISNGGVYGSLLSTPILNPPQSGILGMHKVEKRPVVVQDQIVIRPMMYVALSYDHRLVDGEQAVTFLVRVKERLEDPHRLLLDV
jgi:2-oxoglutarate dehydrogenase E2 component (dihydrolipoamide succinyltransferase)